MSLPRLMLALMFAFTGALVSPQTPQPAPDAIIDDAKPAPKPWDKTLNTSMPINYLANGCEWVFLGSGTDKSEIFVNTKELGAIKNEITVWVRTYYFSDKTIGVAQWSTKIKERETAVTNLYIYNMITGENIYSMYVNKKKEWTPIVPGTSGETLLNFLKSQNKYNKISSSFNTGKEKK